MTKAKDKPKRSNEHMLRSLSGEKLAAFLSLHLFCPRVPSECDITGRCGDCILRWLKREAEE